MNLKRHGPLVALAVLLVFGAVRYPAFFTSENLLNVLRQNSMVAIVALGMTAVVIAGGIDLSVGSLLALGGLAAASLSAYGTAVAVGAGVGVAALLGFVNGIVVTRVRVPPFVATLAMMVAARGAALGLTGETSVPLARSAAGLAWLGRGWLGPVPVPVALAAVLYVCGGLVLRYTTFGRHVYAAGDDGDAARLLGLRVDRVLLGTHVLSGALAGLAGVVLAARLSAGQPVAGTGWELDAIAAVVVGGTLLTGGEGGVGRTLVGAVLLGLILNLLNLEGTLSPWWQWVIRGGFLLAVVALQAQATRGDAPE